MRCVLLFPAVFLLLIMPRDQEQKPLVNIVDNPMAHAATFAHQARLPLPPLGIPTFDTACQTAAFKTDGMLVTREERRNAYTLPIHQ